MWIEVTNQVFEKADFKSLNYLYQVLSFYPAGASPRYEIAVNTKKVKNTENFKKLSTVEEDLENFLDLEYINFVTAKNGEADHKILNNGNEDSFSVEEAILFFNQPVSIILENNKNDSLFIEAIIKHFGDTKLQNHLDFGWLQFENAGGCSNIVNFLEGFLKRFSRLAKKNNRLFSHYFRGIIILDSDKDFEGQACKHSSLIDKLNTLDISPSQVHILQKRAMENYLPQCVFEDIKSELETPKHKKSSAAKEMREWLEAFLNLTPSQRNYLNIAAGFPPKNNKNADDGTRKLVGKDADENNHILTFFGLTNTDKNFIKLDEGFKFSGFTSQGIVKTDSNFKNEFPNLFRKASVNQTTLKQQDGKGELEEIITKITQII